MERSDGPPPTPVVVHLLRHGETLGYSTDAGLTPRGRHQVEAKARELLPVLAAVSKVAVIHSPRARAEETAITFVSTLRRLAPERQGWLDGPAPDAAFDNFHLRTGSGEREVTVAYREFAGALSSSAGGATPGWVTEADRFWRLHHGGGDPIGHWLSQPLQHFEPATLVVRRFWTATLELVRRAPSYDQLVVCTHSGPIRAIAAHALGYDPGEPVHLADLRVEFVPGADTARLSFGTHALDIAIPTAVTPSWFDPQQTKR